MACIYLIPVLFKHSDAPKAAYAGIFSHLQSDDDGGDGNDDNSDDYSGSADVSHFLTFFLKLFFCFVYLSKCTVLCYCVRQRSEFVTVLCR